MHPSEATAGDAVRRLRDIASLPPHAPRSVVDAWELTGRRTQPEVQRVARRVPGRGGTAAWWFGRSPAELGTDGWQVTM